MHNPDKAKTAEYILLRGLEHGNRFITRNDPSIDQTKLADGTLAYEIFGYADTITEAQYFLHGGSASADRSKNTTRLKPWEQKTVEQLSVHELEDWVQWYTHERIGPVSFEASNVVHNVLLWERSRVQQNDPPIGALVKAIYKLYCTSNLRVTFGQWVMNRYLPKTPIGAEWRDFVGAQRDSDAKTYLKGILMSNRISYPQLLAQFLEEAGQD